MRRELIVHSTPTYWVSFVHDSTPPKLLEPLVLLHKSCRSSVLPSIPTMIESYWMIKESTPTSCSTVALNDSCYFVSRGGGTRTHTPSQDPDFKSGASADSATPPRFLFLQVSVVLWQLGQRRTTLSLV